jgi:hypothetical protein
MLVLFLVFWIGLGVIYGMFVESWGFILALYFAVSTLSSAGLQTPTCIGDDLHECRIPDLNAMYVGVYIMVGVPLYFITLGLFSRVIAEYLMDKKESMKYFQPIEANDFKYATTLLSDTNSTTLQLGI